MSKGNAGREAAKEAKAASAKRELGDDQKPKGWVSEIRGNRQRRIEHPATPKSAQKK